MSVFKDFPDLENLEKKFKDFQRPARALYVRTSVTVVDNSKNAKFSRTNLVQYSNQ